MFFFGQPGGVWWPFGRLAAQHVAGQGGRQTPQDFWHLTEPWGGKAGVSVGIFGNGSVALEPERNPCDVN